MEKIKSGYKTYYLFFKRKFIFEKMNIRTVVKGIRIKRDGYALFKNINNDNSFGDDIGLFKGWRLWITTYFSCFIGFSTNKLS